MEISMFIGPLIGNAPILVFWIAVIIFASVVMRRGGGRAARFLITGAGLKIAGTLLNIPVGYIPIWLRAGGYSVDTADSIASYCGIFIDIIGMAGIICLLYAFWIRFKETDSMAQVVLTQH